MRLTTARLVIEPMVLADIDGFVAYRHDPETARYQGWASPYPREHALELLSAQDGHAFPQPGQWMQFAVRLRSDATLVGDVAVHAHESQPDSYELGVTFAPQARGQGYATEAMRRVVGHLIAERGAHRIVAECDERNTGVQRLLRRVGMRREATLREVEWFKSEWVTLQIWALLGSEWNRSEWSSR